jgi:uncharacterized protein (TIGR00290 family)
MSEKILFAWSGGKDSAMALYELQKAGGYEISTLLTTVTEGYNRISMHGVRHSLLKQQAQSLGLPLEKVYIAKKSSDIDYETRMRKKLLEYKARNVLSVAFGDIFLEDLRKYREVILSRIEMKAIFPVWKRDTAELSRSFIAAGFKAIITCVDSNVLAKSFAGKLFDLQLLFKLPPDVDPFGENGEFHSFVYDGPIFREKVAYKKGNIVCRENRFYYCDLIPG